MQFTLKELWSVCLRLSILCVTCMCIIVLNQLHEKFWIFGLNFRLWEETSVNVWITAINKWRYYRCDACFESVDGEV